MRLSSGWAVACVLASIACAGCTTERTTPDAGSPMDSGGGGGMDAGTDAGVRTCTIDSECDDAIACTADTCAVGNVCRNTPLDELCPAEERCIAGTGCRMGTPSVCTVDADCSDGAFCNGPERCVGPEGSRTCVMGTAIDCDDGNACTIDSCDESIDGCTYAIAPGCDAGTSLGDGGIVCDPFEAGDYPGTYTLRPAQLSACIGSATYNISEMTVSVSAGTLSVRADRFTLTQSGASPDGSFDVSFSDGCASFRLQGMFTCADRWEGSWTASFSGSCATCPSQSAVVRGSRR